MIDYSVHLVALPEKVQGASVMNPDGSFDIYINSLLPAAEHASVLEHELLHIKREHFSVSLPISLMERQADGEHVNVVLHPPAGMLPVFASEAALLHWLKTVAAQQHIDLFKKQSAP